MKQAVCKTVALGLVGSSPTLPTIRRSPSNGGGAAPKAAGRLYRLAGSTPVCGAQTTSACTDNSSYSVQDIQKRKIKVCIASLAQQFLNFRNRRKARHCSHPYHCNGSSTPAMINAVILFIVLPLLKSTRTICISVSPCSHLLTKQRFRGDLSATARGDLFLSLLRSRMYWLTRTTPR